MISPGKYLSTSFDNPDREYVRGDIVERGMPDLPHSKIQGELCYHFWPLSASDRLFPCLSTRMRLAPDLYRIADVAVFANLEPKKLAEYEKWGVRHIWVVDPENRTLATYEVGVLRTVTQLTLPGYPIEFSGELFS